MRLDNLRVYGLEESIIGAGYPGAVNAPDSLSFENKASTLRVRKNYPEVIYRLGSARVGTGHDCFLKGIVVQGDLTCSQAMHMQILRYHFFDIVSSQSKMHKLTQMDINRQCNDYVDKDILNILNKKIEHYNDMKKEGTSAKEELELTYLNIIYNCPMGLELTFRFTTSYLQLKTIYQQRKGHRLPEWRRLCKEILLLPQFTALTGLEQ